MSKKHTHGPIPKGNQQKYGIEPSKPPVDEEDQSLVEPDAERRSNAKVGDEVADEKGHIHRRKNTKRQS